MATLSSASSEFRSRTVQSPISALSPLAVSSAEKPRQVSMAPESGPVLAIGCRGPVWTDAEPGRAQFKVEDRDAGLMEREAPTCRKEKQEGKKENEASPQGKGRHRYGRGPPATPLSGSRLHVCFGAKSGSLQTRAVPGVWRGSLRERQWSTRIGRTSPLYSGPSVSSFEGEEQTRTTRTIRGAGTTGNSYALLG